MLVDDTVGTDADPDRDGVLVVINASRRPPPSPGPVPAGRCTDVQAGGGDAVVKGSTVAADAVTVPARTTAVFER